MNYGNRGPSVALTKCYFCHKDHQILLARRIDVRNRHVEAMHGKVVDMSPCNECEAFMKQGIILISIDNEKSDPGWDKPGEGGIPNPYRTGGWVVTEEAFKRIFQDGDNRAVQFGLKHRWMFIEDEAARKVGLFDQPPTEGK